MPDQVPLGEVGFLRLPQLIAPHGPVPLSRSTIWAWVKAGRFPAPVKLGPHTTAWQVAAVRAWLEDHGQEAKP